MIQIDLFGNPAQEPPPKREPKQKPNKRPPNNTPPFTPKTPVKPAAIEVKKEETGDLNAQYTPGETVKYQHPNKEWLTGTLLGFYEPRTPDCTKQKKIFSFIEIDVNGVIHKAYSLSQLKKIG